MTAEFAIPIHDLDAGGRGYVFPVRAHWVRGVFEGQEATAAGPDGVLDIRLSKSGHDVVARGRLRVELTTPCARCLEPAKVSLDQPLSALLVPAHAIRIPESGEYEFHEDEADVMPYDGETVVLDDLVRDELLLAIPMIPLCSEECPGISPEPALRAEPKAGPPEGQVDPRLAPLLRFKKKE